MLFNFFKLQSEYNWFHVSSLPPMLQILVKNSQENSYGYRGNRFSKEMNNLSGYIYVRAQKSAFNFLSANLNGPSIWTVKSFIDRHNKVHRESDLFFDKLVEWLKSNNFPMEVVLAEDGTKIVSKVEYCSRTDTLIGLVAPNDDLTGFPKPNFFKTKTAEDIAKYISLFPVASYVQVILAVPNVPHAPAFVLGYFSTDNTFTTTEVIKRNSYMRIELQKRGVTVLGTSTDGDGRPLNALKIEMDFGKIYSKGSLKMLANPDSSQIGNIDGFHKAKGLVDRLFKLGIMMRLGNFCPSVNHLIMVYKSHEKFDHELTLKDLDVTDHMNYQ